MRRPRGVLRLAVAALLAVLALAGCELDATLGITVDRDGGGTLRLDLAADADLVARAEEAGVDPFADVVATAETTPGWSAAAEDGAAGGRRVTLAADFDDPDELAALTEDLAAALEAPELAPLQPFSVEVTDEAVGVIGGAALVPTDAVTTLGLSPDEAVAALAEAVDYRVTVALPGAVVETNADRVPDEGPLVWEVVAGERVAVSALGERPPPWWLWPVVGGAAGLVVIALGVWWWRRRRARRGSGRRRGAHAS